MSGTDRAYDATRRASGGQEERVACPLSCYAFAMGCPVLTGGGMKIQIKPVSDVKKEVRRGSGRGGRKRGRASEEES
eukprot:694226-Rhodomonas_salina.2